MERCAILIPAYRPDGKLVELLDGLRPRFKSNVVVDDGSDSGGGFSRRRPAFGVRTAGNRFWRHA